MPILRGCLIRVTLITLSVLFTCSMIEGAARLYIRVTQRYTDTWAFRASHPAPYQNADYYSAEFLRESQEQPRGWIQTGAYLLPNDYAGTWFNVRNHRRVTTDQPSDAQHTLYLFGGSTIYNSEVPDNYTVASQLQRMLNETMPGMYRVENIGVTSVTSTQEVARLRTLPLNAGDLVVMFHGVNDAFQGIYYGVPGGQMVDGFRQQMDAFTTGQRLRFNLWQQFSPTLDSAALFFYPYSLNPPSTLAHTADLSAALQQQYTHNMHEAEAITETAGANLIVILQPNLFTVSEPTRYELRLRANPYLIPNGVDVAFEAGYAALRQADHPARWVDGSAWFDAREGEIFLDYCHVTHEGNRMLAAGIAGVIRG